MKTRQSWSNWHDCFGYSANHRRQRISFGTAVSFWKSDMAKAALITTSNRPEVKNRMQIFQERGLVQSALPTEAERMLTHTHPSARNKESTRSPPKRSRSAIVRKVPKKTQNINVDQPSWTSYRNTHTHTVQYIEGVHKHDDSKWIDLRVGIGWNITGQKWNMKGSRSRKREGRRDQWGAGPKQLLERRQSR